MHPLGAVTYEDVRWEPQVHYAGMPPKHGTYHPAVPASIAELDLVLPDTVLAEAEAASREIARFDAELGSEIAPFAAVLLRSESAASSQIENLSASARSIAEEELVGGTGKRNAADIVANTAAMQAALDLSGTINAAAILAMHAALMANQPRHTPGQWRTEPVWIGRGSTPVGATFVGPRHELIPAAIDDLIAFTKRTDTAVLPLIAVAHAQFETLHPFTDGNGRTGRALVQAMLRNKALTRQITVPVSAGLLADTDGYIGALTAYREGDAAPIVERFAEASLRATVNGRQLVTDLRTIRASWNDRITARADSGAWKVADLLTSRPVINAALLVDKGIVAQTAHAQRVLTPLVEAGVIIETTAGRRNRVWRSPEVLAGLDAFAERVGRRVDA